MGQDTKEMRHRQAKAEGSSDVCSGEAGMRPWDLMSIRDQEQRPPSIFQIFRGSSSAVTGCRWCGISYSQLASPRRHASCSDV